MNFYKEEIYFLVFYSIKDSPKNTVTKTKKKEAITHVSSLSPKSSDLSCFKLFVKSVCPKPWQHPLNMSGKTQRNSSWDKLDAPFLGFFFCGFLE